MKHHSPDKHVFGLILAGGEGRRMGGADKGLLTLHDSRRLVDSVIERFRPQVDELFISANRNLDVYSALGHPVIQDNSSEFQGPMAGILAGLIAIQAHAPKTNATTYLACAPCDSPCLPLDLVSRLLDAIETSQAEAAYATTTTRSHPIFLLCKTSQIDNLTARLANRQQKLLDWLTSIGACPVEFPEEAAFRNVNQPSELEKLKASLTSDPQ